MRIAVRRDYKLTDETHYQYYGRGFLILIFLTFLFTSLRYQHFSIKIKQLTLQSNSGKIQYFLKQLLGKIIKLIT